MNRRVIFPDPDIWTQPKETVMTANPADLIPLRPTGAVSMRYGQTPPDTDGTITEVLRIELDTDRGPFGLEMSVATTYELIECLLQAVEKVPAERQTWEQRNQK
ncbi:hypothetical protein ACNUDN_00095 [Mycobacterium sp. smrl_JER01]|uniref:hypothetical protein n=1 Tax=Mycobacterium sp. smrl_JER01 TaxID=3402633 RepID=UPI003AC2F15E